VAEVLEEGVRVPQLAVEVPVRVRHDDRLPAGPVVVEQAGKTGAIVLITAV
jgi:uncharacterized protein YabE (DUF348 family)